jgi:hypothetical protein
MSLIRDEHKDWKFIVATVLAFIAMSTFSIARDVSALLSIIESWGAEDSLTKEKFICTIDRK